MLFCACANAQAQKIGNFFVFYIENVKKSKISRQKLENFNERRRILMNMNVDAASEKTKNKFKNS